MNRKPRPNKFTNKRGNAKKPDYMSNKEVAETLKTEESRFGSSPNDLSWYVVDQQILNDAARLPYSLPVGIPFKREGKFSTVSEVMKASYDDSLPGILVSRVMPVLGNAQAAGDTVNVAANSVYQFVRSRISGSRPYDAVDMMIYLGAMDSLFCLITWITRLYSTVFTYHQANRYLSRALIEAQAVDYDDLVKNLSTFRQRLNVTIAKVRALYLPAVLPIFKRHSWIFSNYYIEGDSEKDQIYMHAPAGYHKFTLDATGAGKLHAFRLDTISGNALTCDDMINILDTLINPIYDDEDFNRISGDMLKAYEGNVFTLSELPDITTVQLMHDEEVLLQFKNAKYMSIIGGDSNLDWKDNFFDYEQDANKRFLKFISPKSALECIRSMDATVNNLATITSTSTTSQIAALSAKFYEWSKDTILTTPHFDVQPGENMINSRLTLAADISNDSSAFWKGKIADIYFGTEWPVSFSIFCYHRDKATYVTTLFRRIYERVMCLDIRDTGRVQQALDSQWPILSAFRYIPEICVNILDDTYPRVYESGRSVFEVDNYSVVDQNVISGLHNSAVLGEFNIPNLAVGH